MATVKYSRQREAIKNFLMSRKDHPTAEVVFMRELPVTGMLLSLLSPCSHSDL